TVDLAPEGFWQRVRDLCDRHGCLLVFDEIPLCMGRTGRMFACEHDGVTPDILVLGKALGAGVVPLAAMLARSGLDVAGHTSLGHFTHEKSPLLCAAALAALDVLRDEGLIERSRELGERLMSRLRELQRRHADIADVRGRGLLVGVEIGGAEAAATAERLMYACLERGLSFKVSGGRVLTLTPPLTISVSDLDRAVEILGDAFASLGRVRPGA
ncbi:MAG: aminotransferase class III-fold pyridoxal phosphate-dependent enzyme, partial [Phycisphaerales bacterium]|nr:aminotransferase class III-fold pyridoxal phosphate-dependent enzyme [Phycisphaerales bacterium]